MAIIKGVMKYLEETKIYPFTGTVINKDEEDERRALDVKFFIEDGDGKPVPVVGDSNGNLRIAPNVDVEVNLAENIGLLNKAEEEVNPATEDKQDDIITALGLVAPAGSITSGRKTITTHNVPEQITASSTPIKSVTIQALPGNVGSIAIGSSNAVRASAAANMNGIILEAGDAYPVYVDNLNKFWIDASVNGEGVTYMYHV